MNGPEHYVLAERARERAMEAQGHAYDTDTPKSWRNAAYYNAAAQAHATLALTAAIADQRTEILWGEEGRGYASISLNERDVDYHDGPKPGTWADVIRSTIGGQS